MLICIRKPIVALILVLITTTAHAFDPFTIVTVVGTAANALSAVSDVASEVSGVTDSFTELYSEIDPESEVSDESKRVVDRMREIESLAREAGYTADEMEDLVKTDKSQLQGLATTLRTLTRAIRAGKKVARLFSKLDKKAQMSQIESTSIQREQLKVQYRLLNAQLEENLNRKKEKLLEEIEKKKQIELYHKEITKRGGKLIGRTGVYSFPRIDKVVEKALALAIRMRPAFIGLILLIFLLRVVYYQFGLYGTERYGDLLRDVLICLLLMSAFPQLIHAAIGISNSISKTIGTPVTETSTTMPPIPEIRVTDLSRSLVLTVVWLGALLKYGAFLIADFLFNFGLAFLVILFPLVIFASQMLNFAVAWPLFLGSFILLTLWPFFWNGAGLLASELWTMDKASFSDQLKTFLFSVLQLVSPFVTMAVLKGQSIGGAVKGAVGSASGVLGTAGSTLTGAKSEFSRSTTSQKSRTSPKPEGNLAGRIIGRSIAAPAHLASNRAASAIRHAKRSIKMQKMSGDPLTLGKSASPVKTGRVVRAGLGGLLRPAPATPPPSTKPRLEHPTKSRNNRSQQKSRSPHAL